MAELIYSKYSNERSRRFAVRTDIFEEEDGARYVEKTALYPEGKGHVEDIFRWCRELAALYREAPFVCNQCDRAEEGVRLEYVEGQTLEEFLDRLLKAGRTEEAEENLMKYLTQVKEIYDKEPFTVTEAFREVFGDVPSLAGMTCGKITNIDMVCGNLVLTRPACVLDYEWTFGFPVPCQYVLYRVIHYYLNAHTGRRALDAEKFYRTFGITAEHQECFRKMEARFQEYLTGSHIPMRDMFAAMTPGVGGTAGGGRLQIFFSVGKGFTEEQSRFYPLEDGKVSFTAELPAGCDSVRIDPGDQACAVWVERLDIDGRRIPLEDTAISNGSLEDSWVYIAQGDPNISGIAVRPGERELSVCLHVCPASPEFLAHIRGKEQENRRLRNKVQRQARLITDMKNTKVWKLYQKYRSKVERKK